MSKESDREKQCSISYFQVLHSTNPINFFFQYTFTENQPDVWLWVRHWWTYSWLDRRQTITLTMILEHNGFYNRPMSKFLLAHVEGHPTHYDRFKRFKPNATNQICQIDWKGPKQQTLSKKKYFHNRICSITPFHCHLENILPFDFHS